MAMTFSKSQIYLGSWQKWSFNHFDLVSVCNHSTAKTVEVFNLTLINLFDLRERLFGAI